MPTSPTRLRVSVPRGLLLFTLVCATAASAVTAWGSPEAQSGENRQRTLWLVPSKPDNSTATNQPNVLVEGVAATVTAQGTPTQTPWQILITVDLPLVQPDSLQRFADTMTGEAEALAELGAVSITLRGAGRAVLIDQSRNAEEIAAAFVELGRESVQAGEYFADRKVLSDLLPAATTAKTRRRALIDHFHQEQELLEWQHHSLMDELLIANQPTWLRSNPAQESIPKAVFLVRDDLGADSLPFLRSVLKAQLQSPSSQRQKKDVVEAEMKLFSQRLEKAANAAQEATSGTTRVLTATGYAFVPVALAGPASISMKQSGKTEKTSSTDPRILPDGTASTLIAGSGAVASSPEHLSGSIRRLEGAHSVSFTVPTDPAAGSDASAAAELAAVTVASPFAGEGNRTFWMTTSPPKDLTLARARRFFEGLDQGGLAVQAGLLGELAGGATLETELDVDTLFAATASTASTANATSAGTNATGSPREDSTSARLRVTVLQRRLDQNLEVEQLFGGNQPLDQRRWLLRSSVRLPRDLDSVAVLVEDLETARWGAAMADAISQSFDQSIAKATADRIAAITGASASGSGITVEDASTPLPGAATHPVRSSGTARPEPKRSRSSRDLLGEPGLTTARGRFKTPILQIVAPAKDRLTGSHKFSVLLASKAVRSVAFYLDGEEVNRDDNAPFSTTLDLGASGNERLIRAVGYSGSDLLLGQDEVRVNRALAAAGLRITALSRASQPENSAQHLVAEASLRLSEKVALDRVEFFRNQDLLATMTSTPLRANVGAPPTPDAAARGDFVRVVAWLADGTFMEDVRLLGVGADGGLGDFGAQVQVNLVQVFAVVNDKDGNPIEGLTADDFSVELAGTPVTLQRFSEAEQVPLDLGLVVDSSESMWALMDDTRKAAARFLGDTLTEEDRAMVVDFDNSVRLVHPLTSEVFALIQSLSKLKASGATALYDSIIFTLVNLEDAASSRRAVVLLTDGDDFNSRFEYGRVYESARFAGVPLYFLALSDFFGERRRGVRKTDLESFAKASGGRVFYVKSMDEILDAYSRISRELRSQYLLGFGTEVGLSREELEKVEVKLRRGVLEEKGLGKGKADIRWSVGRSL